MTVDLWFEIAVIIGVFIGAIALCIQAGVVFALYKATKVATEKVMPLIPRVHGILDTTQTTLDQSKQHIVDITAKANNIASKAENLMDSAKDQIERWETVLAEASEKTKGQVERWDGVLTDVSQRTKSQLDRAEMVLDDTVGRVHESVAVVQNGIMKPLREISGVANGVRTAVNHLMKGTRPSVDRVTQDEEMFI